MRYNAKYNAKYNTDITGSILNSGCSSDGLQKRRFNMKSSGSYIRPTKKFTALTSVLFTVLVLGLSQIVLAQHGISEIVREPYGNWQPYSGSFINVVQGGNEANGTPQYICRAEHNGVMHPGKGLAGYCNIGYGGSELVKTNFEVLKPYDNSSFATNWTTNLTTPNAILGGSENGQALYICRASLEGGTHLGKLLAGSCNIGYGGQERVVSQDIEVLIIDDFSKRIALQNKVFNVPEWQKGQTVSNFEDQFDKLPNDGKMPFKDGEIGGTSSNNMFEAYSAGINHPQGMAWAENANKWIITHDTRAGYGEAMYLICGNDECDFHFIGSERHPNGAQVVGDVLVISIDEDGTYFVDIRNPANPREMACKLSEDDFTLDVGGAVGMAWHPGISRHVLTVESGGGTSLLVSNGESLDSENCNFSPVKESLNSDLKVGLSSAKEGLSQIYYDTSVDKLMGIGAVSDGGQKAILEVFDIKPKFSTPEEYYIVRDGDARITLFHDTGGDGPSFRWGGTVRIFPNHFELISAPKLLTGGPAFNYMETNIYSTNQAYEYEVSIDCNVDDIDDEGTINRITVGYWSSKGEYLGGTYRDGIDGACAWRTNDTFTHTTSEPATSFTVFTDGHDEYMIDQIELYQNGDKIGVYGGNDKVGWCLSTDPNDANGDWKGHTTNGECRNNWKFNL